MLTRAVLLPMAVALFLGPFDRAEGQAEMGAAYLVDGFQNVAGGADRGGALLHNLDLMASLDGEALLGVRDLELFIYLLANAGGSVTAQVGDVQGASNIEAPTAVRLAEAWIDKGWNERWSLLFGLYDLNSEFYVVDTGLLFINSAHGIGPEFAESGRNGPSIFPVTSLSVRLRWTPGASVYAMLGVLDAVPGDPGRPGVTAIHVDAEEGALVSVEVGHRAGEGELRRKVALGAWGYTADFDSAVERDAVRRGTFGVYALGEVELYREGGAEDQGVSGYGRVGYADDEVHAVSWSWGGGLVYTGLLPGRDDDRSGVAIAAASRSSRFLRARRDTGEVWNRTELNLEGTYAAAVTSWLRVQPNVQYVISPGMRPEYDNALLLGVRLELSI